MKSDEYYLAELEDKILETVFNYIKNVPREFGATLSGGFDSGLLAALTKPKIAYSVRFPYGPKYDESRYADAIAEHLGIQLITIIPTKEDFEKYFPLAVQVMGEPVSHFSLVPLYMLFKRISEGEIKDVLSGEGPDEYLGGYARQIIFDELKKLYGIPELRNYHGMIDKVIGQDHLVRKYGQMMGYEAPDIEVYCLGEEGDDIQGLIGEMDMKLGVIEKMEQKLANHFGITLHYPYINEEFAEYCYNLPDNLKIRNGVTKFAFRQIAMKYLPEIMRHRSKMGGPVAPVNHWLDCVNTNGEFGKETYLRKQKEILGLK